MIYCWLSSGLYLVCNDIRLLRFHMGVVVDEQESCRVLLEGSLSLLCERFPFSMR